MTQHELAKSIGMPQPSVARIERGTVIPRTATLIAILEATGHHLEVEPVGAWTVDRAAIRRQLVMHLPRRTRLALGRTGRDPMTSPVWILRRLRRFGVPFVLIGDLAEAVHGSPTKVRRVIEVCHASTDVARGRLALALRDLGRTATKTAHLRLLTETAAGDDYEVLVRNAVGMHVDAGILIPVAALDDLIRIRRARCTPGDQQAAAVLRAIVMVSQETVRATRTPRP